MVRFRDRQPSVDAAAYRVNSLLNFFEDFLAGATSLDSVDTTFADLLRAYNSTLPPNFRLMSIGDEVALGKALRLLFGAACIADSWSTLHALTPEARRDTVFVKSRTGRPRADHTMTLSVLIDNLRDALSRQGAGIDILSEEELERLHVENLKDAPDENAEPVVDPTIHSTTITRTM